ncbi:hypothetical protein GCM10010452_40330 [Crossiella cryophila]|uniref:Uncharacterized protein n=1 Tax=Crossiella cryophila TaxID=43355 RepID=A0A7W7FWX4_9PSEU|nr:hypothetical protein [Crossiella cryophila]MBB4680048.1 hypothetical protein [Crossiella cryophila]
MRFAAVGAGTPKNRRAEISSTPRGDIRALCVDRTDTVSDTESYSHRRYLPRAEVSETQDSQFSRTREARWGMTFSALAPAKGRSYVAVWLTNDPAVLLGAAAIATAALDVLGAEEPAGDS